MSNSKNSKKANQYTMKNLMSLKSNDIVNVTLTKQLVNVTARMNGKYNIFSIQPHRESFAFSHGIDNKKMVPPFFVVFTPFKVTPLDGDAIALNANDSSERELELRPNILAVKTVENLQRYIDNLNFSNMTCKPVEAETAK